MLGISELKKKLYAPEYIVYSCEIGRKKRFYLQLEGTECLTLSDS